MLFAVGICTPLFMGCQHRGAAPPQVPASLQCGHWCLLRISRVLGVVVEPQEIIQLMPPDSRGNSLAQLRGACSAIGLSAKGFRENWNEFEQGEFPCIIQLSDPAHFVVATFDLSDGISFFDGDGTRAKLTQKEIAARWTGNVLRISKQSSHVPLPAFRQRDTATSPCVQFETLLIDRGDIAPSIAETTFTFPVFNLGAEPLIFNGVKTDCGCLTVEIPSTPIRQGERAEIILTYRVPLQSSASGVFEHLAVVRSNDPQFSEIRLVASGNTDARVLASPSHLEFGNVVAGAPPVHRTVFLTFTGEDVENFRLTDALCESSGFVTRPIAVDEHSSYLKSLVSISDVSVFSPRMRLLDVSLSVDKFTEGDVIGDISIMTNVDKLGAIPVKVRANVLSPIRSVPKALIFQKTLHDSSEFCTASLVLSARSGSTVSLLAAETGRSDFDSALNIIAEDGRIKLELQVTIDQARSLHRSILKVSLSVGSHGEQFIVPIKIYAWDLDSSDLTMSQ